MSGKETKSPKVRRSEQNKNRKGAVRVHGAGHAQPRVISSKSRIYGIRFALKEKMETYLESRDIKLAERPDVERTVDGTLGLPVTLASDSEPEAPSTTFNDAVQKYDLVDMAFAFAYRLVPDAAFVEPSNLPGKSLPAFKANLAKLDADAAAAKRDNKRRARANQAAKRRSSAANRQMVAQVANATAKQ